MTPDWSVVRKRAGLPETDEALREELMALIGANELLAEDDLEKLKEKAIVTIQREYRKRKADKLALAEGAAEAQRRTRSPRRPIWRGSSWRSWRPTNTARTGRRREVCVGGGGRPPHDTRPTG